MKSRRSTPQVCHNPVPVVASMSPPTAEDLLDAVGLEDCKKDGWCCAAHYVRYLREKYDL